MSLKTLFDRNKKEALWIVRNKWTSYLRLLIENPESPTRLTPTGSLFGHVYRQQTHTLNAKG